MQKWNISLKLIISLV